MTSNNDDLDYEVGYGKPPRHSRFKKGRSGNPKGRPKGNKNAATLLRERLYSTVTVTENGRRRKMTVLEVVFRKLTKSALEGDPRAQDRLIKLLPRVEVDVGANDDAGDVSRRDETDEAILRHFFEVNDPALRDMSGPDQAEDEET